jgi:hypothetical protein
MMSSGLLTNGVRSILGSAFMKNVYSIFRYPDQNRTTLWQPSVGLVSLTNASDASIDFYAVRSLRQSLSSVSAAQRSTTSGSKPSTSSMPQVSGGSGSTAAGYKIASTAVIAAVSTVGFFVLAAAVFCAWWFWLRRKFGASGAVYAAPHTERKPHKSDLSTESLRSKKHNNMQRQKSMIEGYSDSEGDSWLSTTEGGDSIKLGYIPELLEEDEARKSRAADRSSAGSTLQNSSVDADGDEERGVQLIDISDNDTEQPPELAPVVTSRAASGRGGASLSAVRSVTFTSLTAGDAEVLSPRSQTSAYPQKRIHTSSSARSLSLSMSGPFPSPGRQSLMRPDTSPMYDIRANDYFTVTPGSSGSTTARGREVRRVSSGALEARDGSESRGRRSSPHPQGFISSTMVEEPSGMSATECEERRGEREG